MKCPDCNFENPTIGASHGYSIVYSEETKKWSKCDESIQYVCLECYTELEVLDIKDILEQVGEL